MEYSILIFFFWVGLVVNMIISTPLIVVVVIFLKLSYISSKSKSALDAFVRLIDICITPFCIPALAVIIYAGAILSETKLLFAKNLIQVSGIYREQNDYINSAMDGSIPKNDSKNLEDFEHQHRYLEFKKYINPLDSRALLYDPTNRMISEVIAVVLISTMKIVKREFILKLKDGILDDSDPLFVPTEYVINELYANLFLNKVLRSLVYGQEFKRDIDVESPRFKYLVSALADKTLKGLDMENDSDYVCDRLIEDTGTNLFCLAACLKNHEDRVRFWTEKLQNLYSKSNSQWLLNQFHYCKLFLFNNSFEDEVNSVPTEMWTFNEGMTLVHRRHTKVKVPKEELLQKFSEDWDVDKMIEELQQHKDSSEKVKLVDITSLIGPIVGLEGKLRDIVVYETDNGKSQLPRYARKDIVKMNKISVERFISCHVKSSYTACASYAKKQE
uniref:Uncharacterized protein n=1 Tax=Euplotes harpa TaxID=151035 RepID=A0A7S3N4R1_9SPIT|mmetsp:Transcript_21420/g.24611  ORF Transcript_21420/g.24611 Transcript_21420/m.24611 type:complete len:444 (+) Transcript_21420:1391-2722(+)